MIWAAEVFSLNQQRSFRTILHADEKCRVRPGFKETSPGLTRTLSKVIEMSRPNNPVATHHGVVQSSDTSYYVYSNKSGYFSETQLQKKLSYIVLQRCTAHHESAANITSHQITE